MWVYTGSNHPDVLQDVALRTELLNFAREQTIGELFVNVQMSCSESPEVSCRVRPRDEDALRDFLAAAHEAKLRVHAMRGGVGQRPAVPIWGSAELALEEHHPKVVAMIQALLEFNAAGAERFDGIHLDIEPYTLREYDDGDVEAKRAIILQFLSLIEPIAQALAAEQVPFSLAVGPGWHGYEPEPDLRLEFRGEVKYPTMHLLDMVKRIALMVYLNDPVRLIDKTRPVIEYAKLPEVGAAVSLGVQTCPGRPGTFGNGTRSQMEQDLCQAHREFEACDSFFGFSYFNSTCYRAMEP